MNAGLDGHPDDRLRLGHGRELPRAVRPPRSASTSRSSSATRRSGSRPSAGTTCRPTHGPRTGCGRCSARAMEEGAFGLSSAASTTRPGATRRPRSSRISPARPPERRLLPHARPLHARRPLPRPVPRGDRDRAARRGAGPHHPLLPPHDVPGHPEQMLELVDDARAEGLDVTFDAYPYEWASTRLLILIPTWVQAGGPAPTKERLADRAVRDRIRGELAGARRALRRRRRPRDVRLGYFARPGAPPLGGPDARRGGRRDAATTPSTSCATCSSTRTSARTRSRPARTPTASAASTATRSAWSGTDSTFVGAKPSPRTYGCSRGSSASSCATRRSSASRRRSGG